MTKATLAILVTCSLAHAGGVADKKQRDAINTAAAKAAADLKSCGTKFTVQFDWKAYDAIDWKKLNRNKIEHLPNEHSNLTELGIGLDRLCADPDFKAALVKTRSIIYKPTNDDTITLKATVVRGTLVLSNYSFGSTRHADDYEAAAKAAL